LPWTVGFRASAAANVTAPAYKLVWFVPREALEGTRDAVFAAGGGRVGDSTRCSWYAAGTGTFLAESGREQRVAELRVETVVAAERVHEVVAALRAAHPYEEPTYDLYPLEEL
jgi:hypothetical protein